MVSPPGSPARRRASLYAFPRPSSGAQARISRHRITRAASVLTWRSHTGPSSLVSPGSLFLVVL